MIAEFYLIPESFSDNATLSKADITAKIEALAQDFNLIRKNAETDKLYIHPDIYDVIFVSDITLVNLIYNDQLANEELDRDARVAIKKILVESSSTVLSIENIKVQLNVGSEHDMCYGLLGFNEVAGVPNRHQIIYTLNNWLNFRRYILGRYPKNADFFIDECEKYFPNLYFHPRNKTTVGVLLGDCSMKVVQHLSVLDGKFKIEQVAGRNRSQVLHVFSVNANLDENATLEGDASRKPNMTFNFDLDPLAGQEPVCCEPHMKLCYNDNHPGDTSYSNNRRIYFHEGKSNIKQGRILIGHMGVHL